MPSSELTGPCPSRLVQLLDALLHDLRRLPHLLHADQVTVVAVAVLADGNVEIHLRVALVGLRLAKVPRRAGAADHHAGEAPLPRVVEADHADVDVPLLEDAVAGEELVDVVDHLEERVTEGADVVDQLLRQVLVHATRAEIGRVHAAAAGTLVENHELLALLEAPERWGERADVHRLGRDVEEMREEPADLGIENADELAATRHGDPKEPLDGKREGMLLVHRRDVIEPIEIRHCLEVRLVLDQLLGAAVKQADMRVDAFDDLAVKLQHQAQNTVRGWMLRPEIDVERADFGFGHKRLLGLCFFVAGERVFGSLPGRKEIEIAELLRQSHRLVNHALPLVVVADLDETGERKVFSERVALEAIVGEDAAEVGVANEANAVEVVSLTLEPVGAGIDWQSATAPVLPRPSSPSTGCARSAAG